MHRLIYSFLYSIQKRCLLYLMIRESNNSHQQDLSYILMLSNKSINRQYKNCSLDVCRITLLSKSSSNSSCRSRVRIFTELHYSQTNWQRNRSVVDFETFTELHYSQTNAHLHRSKKSLKYLQNHTTLKQRLCFNFLVFGLRRLQNYTSLKQPWRLFSE